MAEWSIALPWKGSNWVTGSGVRIPVSPPKLNISNHCLFFNVFILNFLRMTNFTKKINNVLEMLQSLENDINLAGYSLTEKKVFYTISQISERDGGCNITDVINESFLSRSTVYKAIKKLERNSMLHVTQSNIDKREFYLNLSL